MARTVRDTNLETRAARSRLPTRTQPYRRSIDRGLALLYRKSRRGGSWIARRYLGGAYEHQRLGQADDVLDADGAGVLSFHQAQEQAREWMTGEPGIRRGRVFTVGDALDLYLEWFAVHRKGLRTTRTAIEAHIRPALGSVDAERLSAAQIRKWHEKLATTPARLRTGIGRPQKYKELSDPDAIRARKSSANSLWSILRAALNYSVSEGRLKNIDWRAVKPFRGVAAARLRWLTEDECGRLLNAASPDFRRLIHGALATGARYGELTRLECRDLDPDSGSLQVREAKAGNPRWIPLDDGAVGFFMAITAGRKPAERIFLRQDGRAWGKSDQQRPMAEACAAARIEPAIGFHIMRHTWASHRVMRGMPLLVAAQVLGHSSTRMVEKHYGHLAPSYVRDEVNRTAMQLPQPASPVTPIRTRR